MRKRIEISLAVLISLVAVVFVAWLAGSASVRRAEAAVIPANKTEIVFDGDKIHGLKGFTYKVYKDRQDVRGIGMNERLVVVPGRLHVKGKILVHSNSELLNKHMDNNTSFQIVLTILQDSYPEGLGLVFDGCHVDDREFQLDSHGYALTTYSFTAGTVEELKDVSSIEPGVDLTFDGCYVDGLSSFTVESFDPEADREALLRNMVTPIIADYIATKGRMIPKDSGPLDQAMETGEIFDMDLFTKASALQGVASEELEDVSITSKGLKIEVDEDGFIWASDHHNFVGQVEPSLLDPTLAAAGIGEILEAFDDPAVRQVFSTPEGIGGLTDVAYTVYSNRPDFSGLGNAYGSFPYRGAINVTSGSSNDLVLQNIFNNQHTYAEEDDIIFLAPEFNPYEQIDSDDEIDTFSGVHFDQRLVGTDIQGNEITVYLWSAEEVSVAPLTGPDRPEPGTGRVTVTVGIEEYLLSNEDLEGFRAMAVGGFAMGGPLGAVMGGVSSNRGHGGGIGGMLKMFSGGHVGTIQTEPGSELDETLLDLMTGNAKKRKKKDAVDVTLSLEFPEGLGIKQFTFDGCHIGSRAFQLDSQGYVLTIYNFTYDQLRYEATL